MNAGFRDIAAGDFKRGLAKLDSDREWHDECSDLEGPFRLGFPRARGWGEELLVASLIKRHADASKTPVPVFASKQVCSILKQDPAFIPRLCEGDGKGRPPLAIVRQALLGELLNDPFVPLETQEASPLHECEHRSRVGIAWASVSGRRPIPEKSVDVDLFLAALKDLDADFVSLQRKLSDADPRGRAQECGMHVVDDKVLDASTPSAVEALVETIRGLDFLVTISTTTTHIAAALGTRVELIVPEREGQQWFWQVQARHGKCLYPTVKVHLGGRGTDDWWEQPLRSVRAAISNELRGPD